MKGQNRNIGEAGTEPDSKDKTTTKPRRRSYSSVYTISQFCKKTCFDIVFEIFLSLIEYLIFPCYSGSRDICVPSLANDLLGN